MGCDINALRVLSYPVQAYSFKAQAEQRRAPRVVRIGLVQNRIVLPTDASFEDQAQGIHNRVEEIINAAGQAGVKVLCLQECW